MWNPLSEFKLFNHLLSIQRWLSSVCLKDPTSQVKTTQLSSEWLEKDDCLALAQFRPVRSQFSCFEPKECVTIVTVKPHEPFTLT